MPSAELTSYINNINYSLREGFEDKFKTEELGLWEYLHFIDILGWNEDVKYHIVDGRADFLIREKNVGRVNTILSVVCAPIMISNFIEDIIRRTNDKGIIDVKLITTTIQKFSKTRGMCVLPNKELLKELKPYLHDGTLQF